MSKQKGFSKVAIIIIALILISGIGYFASINIRQISTKDKAGTKKYVNTSIGFSIIYPAEWVVHENPYTAEPTIKDTKEMPESQAINIFIAPKELRKLCTVIDPFIPARYLEINAEEGDLNTNRRKLNSKIGGQDYTESSMLLAGKTVYVYYSSYEKDGFSCEDGSVQQFKIILIPYGNNKVFSITTDMYNTQEVKDAITSLQFIKI